MKIVSLIIVLIICLSLFFTKDYWWKQAHEMVIPLGQMEEKNRFLDRYSFENLSKENFAGSEIKLERVMKKEKNFTSYLFSFLADGKKVTGQANIPNGSGKFPVVLMIRGQVDEEIYYTGAGTKSAAAVFAENGFITLAPDFLGFGESESASGDILEARFEKPITVLTLLASIPTLNKADSNKIVFWAHSNGGQITISVLEISRRPIPTSFWAPVTKGFPESVLTYIGEMDDNGVIVKNKIDEFQKNYNAGKYSIDNYFADIQAPIILHQGTADALVPVAWSDEFVNKLELLGKDVTYHKYRNNDHNLKQDWDLVVQRDLVFFKKQLGIK